MGEGFDSLAWWQKLEYKLRVWYQDYRIRAWKAAYARRMDQRLRDDADWELSEEFLRQAAEEGWRWQVELEDGSIAEALNVSPDEAADEELSNWD